MSSAKWLPFCSDFNVFGKQNNLGPYLQTWINFNPSMDMQLQPL